MRSQWAASSSWVSSALLTSAICGVPESSKPTCPNNPIGTVDLLFATSHGAIAFGSLPFVHGLQPRVVLMQNGTRKGGAPDPMKTILASPALENLWQMHWLYNAGVDTNTPGLFIANIEDAAYVARRPDGAAPRWWSWCGARSQSCGAGGGDTIDSDTTCDDTARGDSCSRTTCGSAGWRARPLQRHGSRAGCTG